MTRLIEELLTEKTATPLFIDYLSSHNSCVISAVTWQLNDSDRVQLGTIDDNAKVEWERQKDRIGTSQDWAPLASRWISIWRYFLARFTKKSMPSFKNIDFREISFTVKRKINAIYHPRNFVTKSFSIILFCLPNLNLLLFLQNSSVVKRPNRASNSQQHQRTSGVGCIA